MIKTLILPPFSLIFIQALGLALWWTRRKRLSYALILGPWAAWLALSCPRSVYWMMRGLEFSSPPLNLRDPALATRADAIVVLGAGRYFSAPEYGETTVPVNGLERLRYAAELYKKVGKPVLVSGGRSTSSGPTEASVMADVLERDFSVPVRWQEGGSTNTWENAMDSARLLLPQGVRRIFLVTHASHMARALYAFQRAGFTVVAAPMGFESTELRFAGPAWLPTDSALRAAYRVLYERFGGIWYHLKGAF